MEELLTNFFKNINPMIVLVALVLLISFCWIAIKNRKVISDFFNDLYNRKKIEKNYYRPLKITNLTSKQ